MDSCAQSTSGFLCAPGGGFTLRTPRTKRKWLSTTATTTTTTIITTTLTKPISVTRFSRIFPLGSSYFRAGHGALPLITRPWPLHPITLTPIPTLTRTSAPTVPLPGAASSPVSSPVSSSRNSGSSPVSRSTKPPAPRCSSTPPAVVAIAVGADDATPAETAADTQASPEVITPRSTHAASPTSSTSASASDPNALRSAAAAAAGAATTTGPFWNLGLHGIVSVRQLKKQSSSSSSWSSSSSSSSPPFLLLFFSWLAAWQSSWRQWLVRRAQMLQYRLMLLFRLPTWGKLVALVCVGLPIVLVGSWMLMRATNMAWGEAAQLTFYVLQNVPGADITRFPQASARLVLVAIHLLSLYTFATLVGLLTEDVRSNVEEIRCGNFPLPSRDHTVVLNCGGPPSQVIGALQKILDAREAHGSHVYAGDIAVLSTHPKEELDKMIADVLPKQFGRVVTRHGSPIKVSDLERVAAGHARTVLLLAPDRPVGHLGPALQQQLCLTALRSLHPQPHNPHNHQPNDHHPKHNRSAHHPPPAVLQGMSTASSSSSLASSEQNGGSNRPLHQQQHHHHHHYPNHHHQHNQQQQQQWGRPRRQRVVVESSTATMSAAVTAAAAVADFDPDDPLQVTYVSSASSTSRVAVQCAVQPGLAAVFDAVFCRAEDASLRLLELPSELAGHTFAEVRRRFRRAVLCGILPGVECSSSSSSSSIILSPPDDWVLQQYDGLLLLAATREDCTYVGGEAAPEPLQLPPLSPRYDGQRSRPHRLMLLALDSCLSPTLLAALDEFGAPGCCVTVVSPEPCSGLPSGPTPLNQLVLRNHVGDPLSPGALLGVDVAAADAVILSGTEGLLPDDADAVAVGTALLLQRLVADPWVMSCGGAEEVAAAAAVAASIDPDEYWRSAILAGDSARSNFSSIRSISDDDRESTSASLAAAAAAAAPFLSDEQRMPPPSRPLTFVCSVRDPQTRSVLQYIGVEACRTAVRTAIVAAVPGIGSGAVASRGLSIEVIEPQALINGMLAQVGAEPLIVSALEDLLDEEGYEIYIKRCDRYGIPPYCHVNWSQVSELVRSDGEVALGYCHRGVLHLAPPADMEVQLVAGDKLVVLAEGF